MKKELIDISQIKIGDTIEHNGEIKTVSKKDIRYSEFMGLSIFGDTYSLGYKKVVKIIF